MHKAGSYRWLILSIGWFIYFSFGLINTAIAPLITPIMSELGLTYTQMGIITGAWQLIYIFTAQPLGFSIDRLGVYRSLLFGILVVSISSIIRAFISEFWGLFASVAIFGFGGPMISIGTQKLISVWFTGEERGTASGINASGSALGSMAALALTNSFVLPMVGSWRNVFLGYGIIGLVIAIIWFIVGSKSSPQNEKLHTEYKNEKQSWFSTARELLKHRNIWIIVLIGVVAFMTNHALKNWLPRILELKGLSSVVAGYATSLMALAGILGSLIISKASYHFRSRKFMIALIFFITGISILLIGIGNNIVLWIGLVSAGFLTRAMTPLLLLTLMEMSEVGSEYMGSVGGLYFSMGEIGGFLGPFMMGYIKDLTGSFLFAIYFLAILTEFSIIILGFLKSESN